jgi:hypothetical protein
MTGRKLQTTSAKPDRIDGVMQRQCACGNHSRGAAECAQCRNIHDGILQRHPISYQTGGTLNADVPAIVREVLNSPGQPLDAETRRFMESRFHRDLAHVPVHNQLSNNPQASLRTSEPGVPFEQKADRVAEQVTRPQVLPLAQGRSGDGFSSVRVHTDAKAQESARYMNALAYTVGNDVVFGAGHYAPDTPAGNRLLAHELKHVIQQANVGARLQLRPPWERYDDPLERDALDTERGWPHDESFGNRRPLGSTMSWREAREIVPPSRPRPEAARVQDTRLKVLPTERAAYNDLSTYVATLPARLRTLAGSGAAGEPWLTSANPSVQSALRVLDQLSADLSNERIVVRFDQATGTAAAASYDYLNDIMHLRPFSGADQRTLITIDLLHEYTHILQDHEAERVFARSTTPRVHTRQEDLARETEARREQVYFGDMLRVLGEPVPNSAVFGTQLSDSVFRGRFERERTAATARERTAATRDIRTRIETAYASQLATNSSIKTYRIELSSGNYAFLHLDIPGVASPRNLGLVPAGTTRRDQLSQHLEQLIRALPEFPRLSNAGGTQRFAILTFAVVYDGDHIMEFGIRP